MNINWIGHSSFLIRGKNATLITDPFEPSSTGIKSSKLEADIVTISHDHGDHNAAQNVDGNPKIVRNPGEYEIKEVSIFGISTFHDNKKGEERGGNTVFTIHMDGMKLCHLGDLGHKLGEDKLGEIGTVDILFVPVGGVYTIDASQASEVVSSIDPKVVIPMHYKIPNLNYDLAGVEDFIKETGLEPVSTKTYTITFDKLPEDRELIVFETK